jgi:hypothetical protein
VLLFLSFFLFVFPFFSFCFIFCFVCVVCMRVLDNVMIFGESAGGASVEYHLLAEDSWFAHSLPPLIQIDTRAHAIRKSNPRIDLSYEKI